MFNAILCSQFSPCLPAGHSSKHVPFMWHPFPLQLLGQAILQSAPYRPGGHTVGKQGMIFVCKSCIRISVLRTDGNQVYIISWEQCMGHGQAILLYILFIKFSSVRKANETVL